MSLAYDSASPNLAYDCASPNLAYDSASPNLAYDLLAPYYDAFQSSEDPAAWARFLSEAFAEAVAAGVSGVSGESGESGVSEPQGQNGAFLACDLGCGTGQVCRELLKLGFDVIGIDNSPNMLAEAMNPPLEEGGEAAALAESEASDGEAEMSRMPLYLLQDIRDFELYGTVNFLYSTLDTMNHLPAQDVSRVLRLTQNYLHPGGVLLFDILTHDYMAHKMGHELYYEIGEDHAILWQNNFSEALQQNQADITIFTATTASAASSAPSASSAKAAVYERSDLEVREFYHDPTSLISELEGLGFEARQIRPAPSSGVDEEQNRHFIMAVKTSR